MLAQHRGNSNGWRPAVSQTNEKKQLIREQLQMLLKIVPEFCQVSGSRINPGSEVFSVKLNGIDISATRSRFRLLFGIVSNITPITQAFVHTFLLV